MKKGYNENKVISELKELCQKELSVYAQPKEFEFRDNLPKTLYNKIDYKSLEEEEKKKYKE